ncbi:uncharacterized protein FA14DRAFT_190485 [Meira miltonrushii]|uniref:BRCT domain-containing protein n=1 Tax=Meira miltonrushii TaxID=1280837 RepID=A0A316VAU4_9BASI|nr:uncharacterized protein FA14DRAFT_190485 [Meira miltonrushii]PWN33323.1 hypothetical protein FA14DRAFT_190485 [Meira miltonrushii]
MGPGRRRCFHSTITQRRMRRDVNESNTNRTSSSNETIDSIQAAFASLDALSYPTQPSQSNNVNSPESRHERPTFLRAQPKQAFTNEIVTNDDDAFRPLCGGPTKAEMLMRTQAANKAFSQRQKSAPQNERSLPDNSANIRPSHIILSSPQPWQGVISTQNAGEVPEERTTPTRTIENDPKATEEVGRGATTADLALPSGSVENSPKKKRTLAWAAKRDRRNARRRPSPPLTRRRAALVVSGNNSPSEQTEDAVQRSQDQDQTSTPFMPNTEPSVDITDPSNGDKTIQDALKRGVAGRKAAKSISRSLIPQLDMTLTEPPSPQQHDEEEHALHHATAPAMNESQSRIHEQSSDTESDGEGNSIRPIIPPAVSSGSNTEDEHEMLSVNRNAAERGGALGVRDAPVKRKRVVKQARKEPKKATRQPEKEAGNTTEKEAAVPEKSQKKKSKKNQLKGRPLFEGLVFVVIGFWTKVRMYEKLIEKHAGTLVKASQSTTGAQSAPLLPQFDHGHLPDANPDGITHIVYCPHGMYTPDPKIVREAISTWKKEAGKSFNLQNIEVVDSRWISDCISNCLRKEDLLSAKEYRIAV